MGEFTTLKAIGERIKLLREEKGITQEVFANEMGATRQTVAKWETGRQDFKTQEIIKMADLFNVSADYLLGRSKSRIADKVLTDVADYLGISDWSVLLIREYSGKLEEGTAMEYYLKRWESGKPFIFTDTSISLNSHQADICDWVINNLLGEAYKTISVLLADMYKVEKYDKRNISFDLSDKAYMFLNRLTDRYKYKIDKLLIDCSESTLYSKYNSIYESDFGNVEDWYCGEFRNIDEVDEYMKNSNDAEIKIEIDAEGATNIIGNSESETFREIVRIVNEHNKSKKTKAGD